MIFKRVNDLCDQYNLDRPNIQACSDQGSDFIITRAQLSATIQADTIRGAYVTSEKHDRKCLELLESSKNSDVILFPEYCFSFGCIEQIVQKRQYWPLHYKLWCLPCQGILSDVFREKLDLFEQSGAVVLREGLERIQYHGAFINALLYCFITTDLSHQGSSDATKIVLLPQLKTQNMADREDKCETCMTRGETIFVFGEHGGNCLVSLLCADVLNPKLSWKEIKNEGKNFILLHPQLNSKPTQDDFQNLRFDMFQGSDRHVYISANWAKGTMDINNPWSCVYFKHEADNRFFKWFTTHRHLLESNPRNLLYGGFYTQKRVSIWYAWASELVQVMKIQKPYCSMAVMRGSYDVTALQCLHWEVENGWLELQEKAEQEFRRRHYTEQLERDAVAYSQLLERICENPAQCYPFEIAEKVKADRFWELVQAKEDHVHTQLDQNEIPYGPVILFTEHNVEDMKAALRNMRDLGKILENSELPKYLDAFHAGYRFEMPSGTERLYNIVTDDGGMQIILAIAEDDAKANRFINNLKKDALKEHSERDSEFPYLVCVVARETLSGERRFYPEFDPTITAPDRGRSKGIITEGGNV